MNLDHIPIELKKSIGAESINFILKSRKNYPLKKGLRLLSVSLSLIGFTWLSVIPLFGPILRGETVHFAANERPTSASLDNLASLFFREF